MGEIFNFFSWLIPIALALVSVFRGRWCFAIFSVIALSTSWYCAYQYYLIVDPKNLNGAAGSMVSVLGWIPGLLLFLLSFVIFKLVLISFSKIWQDYAKNTSR